MRAPSPVSTLMCCIVSGFTSGITSVTFSSIPNAELLSTTAGAKERDVDAVEAIRCELLHDVVPVLEDDAAAGGELRGQHFDGTVGEVAVGEELLANGAGDADDGDGGAVIAEGHSGPGGPRGGLGPEGGPIRGGCGAKRSEAITLLAAGDE